MARVRHESSLAREALGDPREHLVERLPQARDLVLRLRDGQAVVERRRGDVRRPASHRFDRPQGRAGERIAGERGEHERERAADQKGVQHASKGLRVVLLRRADHQHEPALTALDR